MKAAVMRTAGLSSLLGAAGLLLAAQAHATPVTLPLYGNSPFAQPKLQARPFVMPKLATPSLTPSLEPTLARRDYNEPLPNVSKLRYLRALGNVVATTYFVWQQNWFTGREYVYLTRRSWSGAFKRGFEWDKDPIQTNFFGHPYNGSLYFEGARATGLTFWEAIPYTVAGCFVWEMLGESERPSMNDMFSTSLGGIILGEMLFRLSSEALDESKSGWQRLGRELLGAGIAPMRGFDRLTTGAAWHDGLPPARKRFNIALNTGLEHLNTLAFNNDIPAVEGESKPLVNDAFLAAVQVRYGDLLPTNDKGTFKPFEAFRLYLSSNLSGRNGLQGMQIFGDGLLYGWNSWVTDDGAHDQDNNVLGFKATYDYQGLHQINLSGVGLGPGNTMIFRRKNGTSFMWGADFQWVPILGTTSAETAETGRDYNLAVGGAFGSSLTWNAGRFGRFDLRARHYLGAVVSGASGLEYSQYSRVSYEIDVVPELLGLGLSSTVISRYGRYDSGTRFNGNFDSLQLYVTLHN